MRSGVKRFLGRKPLEIAIRHHRENWRGSHARAETRKWT
jgi:hypothetical protein